MPSVAIVYRKDKLNKNNEAPVHLRIIKDRKPNYVTTGLMIPEKFWDDKMKCIKGKFPNKQRLNSFLANKFAELQDQVYEHETNSKSLTTRVLKEKIYSKKPTDFFSFAEEYISRYDKTHQISTIEKSRSIIAKLKEFHYGKQLMFQDITLSFLMRYESYMRESLHNQTNTVHRDMRFIRQLFYAAIREDLIESNLNPFFKYKLKLEKTHRTYLTEEELKLIERLPLEPNTKLNTHRDMFLFSSCAGGLRISDILQLKWENFDGSHIHFTIRKTGQQLAIKLPNTAIELINRYKREGMHKQSFVFPILPDDLDMNDAARVHNEISSATAHINKNLKVIAERTGINKSISFHVSRHTWATRALKRGISIDKVSKLMGHAAIRETQIYAKIVNEELDKAMDVFNV